MMTRGMPSTTPSRCSVLHRPTNAVGGDHEDDDEAQRVHDLSRREGPSAPLRGGRAPIRPVLPSHRASSPWLHGGVVARGGARAACLLERLPEPH
jgi:hypothetical protein